MKNHQKCPRKFTKKRNSCGQIWQWVFWQCLPFSWTILRDKHCRHPIAVMEVVDTVGHRRVHCNYNILPVVQEKNSVIQKNNIVSFSFIIIVCFKIISQCLCRSMILFRKSGINCCQIASFRTQLFTHQSMLDFLHRFPIRYR